MSVSLAKSDGCGKNNDVWALGASGTLEGHEPPLIERVTEDNIKPLLSKI